MREGKPRKIEFTEQNSREEEEKGRGGEGRIGGKGREGRGKGRELQSSPQSSH